MLTQTIILSATKYTVKPTVYMMQSDTGRVLACAFADFTVPDGATARLYIHRPNGTFYTETATIVGQVVNVEADQVLTTAGYVNCDLEIEANDETVQSFPFVVRVLATEAGSPQTTEQGVSVAELDERVTALENAPQGAEWGEITGDIADQTDLKNALDGKLDGETSGTTESTFNGRLSHDTSDDSILMRSGDTGVGANLIAGDGEITLGDDVNVIRAREGYAADIGVKNGDTWTYSPIATEAYVDAHSGGDVLLCTYGSQTPSYDEILSAFFAGKVVVCVYNNVYYYAMAHTNAESILFYSIDSNKSFCRLQRSNLNWFVDPSLTRSTSISSSSTNNQYSTALAVYNFVQPNPTLAGTEAALTGIQIGGTKYAVGGGGSTLYRHVLQFNNRGAYCEIITTSNTAFTLSTFKSWLATLGSPLACYGTFFFSGSHHISSYVKDKNGAPTFYALYFFNNALNLFSEEITAVADTVTAL